MSTSHLKVAIVKDLVNHSVATALALDHVGHILDSRNATKAQVKKWLLSGREDYPASGKLSVAYNSSMFALILGTYTGEDSGIDALLTALQHFPSTSKYAEFQDSFPVDTGAILPVAIALGYALALHREFDYATQCMILDSYFDVFQISEAERETGTAIALLIHRLVYGGYFGSEYVYSLLEDSVLTHMEKELLWIIETHPEYDRILEFPEDLVKNLPYSSRLFFYVVFYMLRVDTACNTGQVKSLPREQLVHLLTLDGILKADAGFLYGAVCTVSEHKHPLVPKPLREAAPLLGVVHTSIGLI